MADHNASPRTFIDMLAVALSRGVTVPL